MLSIIGGPELILIIVLFLIQSFLIARTIISYILSKRVKNLESEIKQLSSK